LNPVDAVRERHIGVVHRFIASTAACADERSG
jgi:hypothetical protein